MSQTDTAAWMQEDWNARAREDAHYYVAFGRRKQSEDEFFATAADVVRLLRAELKRLPRGNPRARRAIEIGCGPGRLLKPMSECFGEIHGVDISDEMIRLAQRNLRDVPHAHAHHAPHSDLRAFADDSFDFAYSYAVFQHIPSREIVWNYLREARRVLKVGGILRCQINGLPETAARYDTWSGVRIQGEEVAAFARQHHLQLLALEGVGTQYMWVTLCKKPEGWQPSADAPEVHIRRITNASSGEPVIPPRGRFAFLSIWVDRLLADADLNHLGVEIGGKAGIVNYIGPAEADGLQQVNCQLPAGLGTGLQPVRLYWQGRPISPERHIRVLPPPPQVPRIVSVSDGIDLMAGTLFHSGVVKVTIEETSQPESFQALIGGRPVEIEDIFCTDPVPPRYEINFRLPNGLPPGPQVLEMSLGRRHFAPLQVEIQTPPNSAL